MKNRHSKTDVHGTVDYGNLRNRIQAPPGSGLLLGIVVIRRQGPWRNMEDVEFATLEWVWWFNYHRLLEPIGHVPPAEYEEAFYQCQEGSIEAVGLKQTSLR